jgi:rRNA maturation RNase YbeY
MRFADKIEIIKKDILGKEYSLSVAYVSIEQSHAVNKKYRKKDRPTNVLSFSLTPTSGELLLCKDVIKEEAKKIGKTYTAWLGFLVIHGMLHLKGYEHSSTMSKLEEQYDQKYFSRHRRGLRHDESRSGRILKRRKKS